jgi:hypothetical protein
MRNAYLNARFRSIGDKDSFFLILRKSGFSPVQQTLQQVTVASPGSRLYICTVMPPEISAGAPFALSARTPLANGGAA